MRYLLISIYFLVISCASYPKRNNFELTEKTSGNVVNPYFADSIKDYVYKADISLFKKDFTGILIIKKLRAEQHRVVFTTEMGNKIFDFSFSKEDLKINYILADMNKEMIVNILKKDFKALLIENPFCLSAFKKNEETLLKCKIFNSKHYYHLIGEQLTKIARGSNGNEKTEFLFLDIYGNTANHIKILHKNIDLTIVLKAI